MTQPITETSMCECEYIAFLKTMLAEVLDQDDVIFESTDRGELERECLLFRMSLPLVRVVPDGA